MSLSYHLLDVFTDKVFSGNQLAVFTDADDIDPALFQSIARELNLSETVFVLKSTYHEHPTMRIFTPLTELPTAGHPTIGTAYLLAKETGQSTIIVKQKVGQIKVQVDYENDLPSLITMNQPLPTFGRILEHRELMATALSVDPDDLTNAPIQEVSCGNDVLFIPIREAATLSRIKIIPHLLEELSSSIDITMIYPFSTQGVKGGDVQGRMFAPMLGVYEDPATGSANGPLACYLTRYDLLSMPALSLQGVEMGRPSQLHLDISQDTDGTITAVKVGGTCQLVGKGKLFLKL